MHRWKLDNFSFALAEEILRFLRKQSRVRARSHHRIMKELWKLKNLSTQSSERKSRGWCRISLVLVSIKTCLFSFLSVPCFILLYVPRSLRIYSHSDCYIFPPVHYPKKKKREKCCVVCWGWKIRRIVDDERESFSWTFMSTLFLFTSSFFLFWKIHRVSLEI